MCLLSAPSLRSQEFEIAILRPEPGIPVFGFVEVEAEVYPPDTEVEQVEFYVDGLRVGVVERPPYRILLDLGEENVSHDIEVAAVRADGTTARNSIHTVSVTTDLEIDVDLQQLYVTVERDGRRVLDLDEKSFRILDAGLPQAAVTFERGDVPLTAVLLVDSSTSMQGRKLPTALRGVRTFIRDLKPLDEAKLILFSDHVQLETPFTGSATILSLGLGSVKPSGGTALNDAVFLAQERLETRQGRKVIVLLSDGIDVESILSMEQVRWLSRTRQAALYWIRLPRPGESARSRRYSSWRNARDHADQLDALRDTVADTGGRIITIASIDDVADAFARLLEELREQYVLGYYPSISRGPGAWHKIEVRLDDPRLTVRTRTGYLER